MTKELPRAALIPLLLATAGARAAPAGNEATLPDATPAAQFGPYDLVREVGRGSMGTVYLAEERDAEHRPVALKVAHRPPDTDDLTAQLAFEPQALAALRHEHVVGLLDSGVTADGHPWVAMEYVDGEAIDLYCTKHALPAHERVRLFAAVARAAQHLHERGLVHRDLKPANVLITETTGRPVPKVIDFGFAAQQPTDARTASPHPVAGTPAYMAPELLAARPATPGPRSDVFALGVMLDEMLAAKPQAIGECALLRDVGAIARRARSHDPHHRHDDAGALAADLDAALGRASHGNGVRRLWHGLRARLRLGS